uniref:Auxin response factor n=1 Tax=Rhizophora mucronata TaxID=61149 RepID=A0A2P2JDK1_RHIMU
MVVSLFFEDMQMIAFLHWICPSSHHCKNWLQPICMAINGISGTFSEVNLGATYLQLGGVFLLAQKS